MNPHFRYKHRVEKELRDAEVAEVHQEKEEEMEEGNVEKEEVDGEKTL